MTTAYDLVRELERVKRLKLDLHDPKSRSALTSYAREIENSLEAIRRASGRAGDIRGAVLEASFLRG